MKKDYEICINTFNIFVNSERYEEDYVYSFDGIRILIYLIKDKELFEIDITKDLEQFLDSKIENIICNDYNSFIRNTDLYNSEKEKFLLRVNEYLSNYDIQELINEKSEYLDYRNITQNFKSVATLLKNNEILL